MKKVYFRHKTMHKDLMSLPPYTYVSSHKLLLLPIWVVDEVIYNAFIERK